MNYKAIRFQLNIETRDELAHISPVRLSLGPVASLIKLHMIYLLSAHTLG